MSTGGFRTDQVMKDAIKTFELLASGLLVDDRVTV
jgi:hypothetical protein